MTRIYTYQNCGTCRNALKFLAARGVRATVIPIREQPPTKKDLKQMLSWLGGDLRKLFNTSGLEYRKLGLKEKLPTMSEAEALDLLSRQGNLVKRPFLLAKEGGAVGFKEEEWRKLF